jgi:hypothetical protein
VIRRRTSLFAGGPNLKPTAKRAKTATLWSHPLAGGHGLHELQGVADAVVDHAAEKVAELVAERS